MQKTTVTPVGSLWELVYLMHHYSTPQFFGICVTRVINPCEALPSSTRSSIGLGSHPFSHKKADSVLTTARETNLFEQPWQISPVLELM